MFSDRSRRRAAFYIYKCVIRGTGKRTTAQQRRHAGLRAGIHVGGAGEDGRDVACSVSDSDGTTAQQPAQATQDSGSEAGQLVQGECNRACTECRTTARLARKRMTENDTNKNIKQETITTKQNIQAKPLHYKK